MTEQSEMKDTGVKYTALVLDDPAGMVSKLKEQEKSTKVKKSDENNDYIGQLEKAKKLLDDGALNTSEYEILKKQIMAKIQT